MAEFQANEEVEFGAAAARAQQSSAVVSPSVRRSKPGLRVAASGPPPLLGNPLIWHTEDAVPSLRPGTNADECQVRYLFYIIFLSFSCYNDKDKKYADKLIIHLKKYSKHWPKIVDNVGIG